MQVKNALAVNNELIRKRRRKKNIKRTLLIFILLTSILITLCLKLSYFNLENIDVVNNKIVKSEDIISASNVNKGINIFILNTKKIGTNVLSNPYILKADIIRKFPSTIIISVKEREAVFYLEENKKYAIIDKNGIVLEIKDNIDNMKLTKLEGFDINNVKIGEIISSEYKRRLELITEMTELISLNNSDINITTVNVTNDSNVEVYCGNMLIKLGNINIKDKLNLGLNIIENNNLKNAKGYIDASFDGNPVVFVEK